MRDIRLLRSALDGRTPPVQTNDPGQLKILLRNCKQSVQNTPVVQWARLSLRLAPDWSRAIT